MHIFNAFVIYLHSNHDDWEIVIFCDVLKEGEKQQMEIGGWNITKLLTVMIRMFNYFGFNQKNTDKHRILQDACSCRLL